MGNVIKKLTKQKQELLLKKSLPIKRKVLSAKSFKGERLVKQSAKNDNSKATVSLNKLELGNRKKPLKINNNGNNLKQTLVAGKLSEPVKRLVEPAKQPIALKKGKVDQLLNSILPERVEWKVRKTSTEQKRTKADPLSTRPAAGKKALPVVEEKNSAPATITKNGTQPEKVTSHRSHRLPVFNKKSLNSKAESGLLDEYFAYNDYKNRFYFSLAVTCSLLLFSPFIQESLHFSLPAAFYPVFLWVISSVIFFYGGWPLFIGLSWEIVHRRPGRMTLVILAVALLYAYNTSVALGLSNYLLFGELILLVLIVLLSSWLEQKILVAAFGNAEPMANLMPDKAHKELDQIYKGIYEDIPVNRIHKNDILFVKPGERIPADSIIISGESYLDESKFTGDPKWVFKKKGDKVLGGSLNGEGALRVCVEKVKEDSHLFKIIKLLKQGQQSKTELQLFTERALTGLIIMILAVSILVFVSWLIKGKDLPYALERLVSCLIIACPPAVGLSIAFINNYFINQFAHKGFFVCNYKAFEKANQISIVLFEKTGTLTKGKYEVIYAHGVTKRYNEKSILKWAAAVEQKAHHPIAQALLLKAEELNLKVPRVEDFESLEGKGVQGTVNGLLLKVVGLTYLREHGISEPEGLKVKSNLTRVFLIKNDAVLGVIGLEDNIREEAYQAVRHLQKIGVKCWLLTGDSRDVASNVAEDLGMSGFSAELSPREKEAKIKELQLSGEFVCLVGDTAKDSAALSKAHMSMAVGVKSNLLAEKMDICCINPSPREIANFLLFARNFAKKVQSLVGWIFIYSLVALFLATGVLSGLGILISPVVAAVVMAISSLLIILRVCFPTGFKTNNGLLS